MRIFQVTGSVAASVMAMSVNGAAHATDIPTCLAIPGIVDVPAGEAPPSLLVALKRDIGVYVLPGEDFDADDVVRTGIHHRLIWIRRHGIRWVVAFENGGRGYNQGVLAYDMMPGSMLFQVGRVGAQSGTVCQMTERELWRPED